MSKETLELFWTLAESDGQERSDCARRLVDRANEDASDRDYITNRLLKGLLSSRAKAREGFALAFTWLLQHVPVVKTQDIIDKLAEETHVKSKAKGPEVREARMGRLFGFVALIRSGRLFEDGSGKVAATVVNELLKLAESKSWLEQAAYVAVHQVVRAASERVFVPHVQAALAKSIPNTISQWSPAQLSLFLATSASHPSKKFNLNRVLSAPGFRQTSEILSNAASTFPRHHFVWDTLIPLVSLISYAHGTAPHNLLSVIACLLLSR